MKKEEIKRTFFFFFFFNKDFQFTLNDKLLKSVVAALYHHTYKLRMKPFKRLNILLWNVFFCLVVVEVVILFWKFSLQSCKESVQGRLWFYASCLFGVKLILGFTQILICVVSCVVGKPLGNLSIQYPDLLIFIKIPSDVFLDLMNSLLRINYSISLKFHVW